MTRMGPEPTPAIDRVMRRLKTTDPDLCWVPSLSRSRGYCYVGIGDEGAQPAHRVVYEALVGPIPDGWEVHHLCANPPCVNPDHLRALTPADHRLAHGRGVGPCKKCGADDWLIKGGGRRTCRECARRYWEGYTRRRSRAMDEETDDEECADEDDQIKTVELQGELL